MRTERAIAVSSDALRSHFVEDNVVQPMTFPMLRDALPVSRYYLFGKSPAFHSFDVSLTCGGFCSSRICFYLFYCPWHSILGRSVSA